MSAQDFLALGLLSLLVSSAYWLGREIGKHQQRELWRDHMEKCNRYVYAVDDLDKWCGHQSPHARLIARHLRATGGRFKPQRWHPGWRRGVPDRWTTRTTETAGCKGETP